MIRFSTLDLMDDPKCYAYLVAIHTPVAHVKVH